MIVRLLRSLRVFLRPAFLLRLLVVLCILDAGYVIGIWPEWDLYDTGTLQPSRFMLRYGHERQDQQCQHR